jgi:hypothetical protein
MKRFVCGAAVALAIVAPVQAQIEKRDVHIAVGGQASFY